MKVGLGERELIVIIRELKGDGIKNISWSKKEIEGEMIVKEKEKMDRRDEKMINEKKKIGIIMKKERMIKKIVKVDGIIVGNIEKKIIKKRKEDEIIKMMERKKEKRMRKIEDSGVDFVLIIVKIEKLKIVERRNDGKKREIRKIKKKEDNLILIRKEEIDGRSMMRNKVKSVGKRVIKEDEEKKKKKGKWGELEKVVCSKKILEIEERKMVGWIKKKRKENGRIEIEIGNMKEEKLRKENEKNYNKEEEKEDKEGGMIVEEINKG